MYSEESDQYLSSDSLSDVEKDLRSPLNGWGVPSDAEPGNDPSVMSRKSLLAMKKRRTLPSATTSLITVAMLYRHAQTTAILFLHKVQNTWIQNCTVYDDLDEPTFDHRCQR
jgi:hypothetical protein